jgi:transportin-1
MPVLVEQLDHAWDVELTAVCNNACWASGEIALKMRQDFASFVPPLIQRLIPILNHPEMARSLRENAAISIGRIGISLPDALAPELSNFAENWCKAVRHTRDNEEKESAFQGFCLVVQRNPNAMGKSFPIFCDAIGNCQHISPQLNETFKAILIGFKQMMDGKWQDYYGSFPPALRKRLTEKYQL